MVKEFHENETNLRTARDNRYFEGVIVGYKGLIEVQLYIN